MIQSNPNCQPTPTPKIPLSPVHPQTTVIAHNGLNHVQVLSNNNLIICSWDHKQYHYLKYVGKDGQTISQWKLRSQCSILFRAVGGDVVVGVVLGEGGQDDGKGEGEEKGGKGGKGGKGSSGGRLILWDVGSDWRGSFRVDGVLGSAVRMFVFRDTKIVALVQRIKTNLHIYYFQVHADHKITQTSSIIIPSPLPNPLPIQLTQTQTLAFIPKQPIPLTQPLPIYILSHPPSTSSLSSSLSSSPFLTLHNLHYTTYRTPTPTPLPSNTKHKHNPQQLVIRISDAWFVEPGVLYVQVEELEKLGKDKEKVGFVGVWDGYWRIYGEGQGEVTGVAGLERHRFQFIGMARDYCIQPRVKSQQISTFPIHYLSYPNPTPIGHHYPPLSQPLSLLPKTSPTHTLSYSLSYSFTPSPSTNHLQIKTWPIPELWQNAQLTSAHFLTEIVEDCDQDVVFYVGGMVGEEKGGFEMVD